VPLSRTVQRLLAKQNPEVTKTYVPRRAQDSLLYKLVQRHYYSFVQHLESEGKYLPNYVAREFEKFLECGILQNGFLRLRCSECKHENLVPFSCKGRGFCPSCGGRRLAETSILLSEHIFPQKTPVRQIVTTFPYSIRYLLAIKPELISTVLRIVNNELHILYAKKIGVRRKDALTGAVTLIQRFGSALNLNIHFHTLLIDGIYIRIPHDPQKLVFRKVPNLADDDVINLTESIAQKVTKKFVKLGLLYEDSLDQGYTLAADENGSGIEHLKASSITYRIAMGARKGQKALCLKAFDAHDQTQVKKTLCHHFAGFSVHAATVAKSHERDKIEKLIQYVSRPPVASERLSEDPRSGRIRLKLKTPYSDGTTHLVFEPLELLARLASLVPPPRLNLIRYHGLLAPNCKIRHLIVPKYKQPNPEDAADIDKPKNKSHPPFQYLLKRVFQIDLTICPRCKKAKLNIISAIDDPYIIRKILKHLKLPTTAPQFWPARAPPLLNRHDANSSTKVVGDEYSQRFPEDD
jgi:ribosomal protein S27E